MPILKKYEPVDCFFKNLDSTWFSCQLVIKIGIVVVLGSKDTEQQNERKDGGWVSIHSNDGRRLPELAEDRQSRKQLKTEMVVDGYSGFILLDKNDRPKVALHIENECRWALKKYKKLHPEQPLPHITPHVFRHTFCTNMANAGMNIKNLQYLMGHSDAGVTMNVYTHMSYIQAEAQMAEILAFPTKETQAISG